MEYDYYGEYYDGLIANEYLYIGKIHNSEGYVDFPDPDFMEDVYRYNYFRKDHLVNIREVWSAAWNYFDTSYPATTAQRTHYYPSGLPWRTTTGNGAEYQKLKYNGKEFVEMHGLDEYDSEARWYYPAILRTTTIDPLAEKYYSISPYAWCGNNPVRMVDPDGMDWFVNNKTGDIYYNNTYTKDDLSKIEGEDWSWFGANGMFMKDEDDIGNSDGILAAKNGGEFNINENNPLTKSDDQLVVTMNLEGRNAESFMGDRGYEKVPTKMLAEEFELFPVNQYLPIPSGGSIKVRNLERSEIWLGMTYAPQNSQVSKNTKLFLWEPMVNGNHAVMLEKLTCQVEGVIPMLLRKIGSIYDSAITPQYSHTNTYYNWNNYPSNGV